MTSRTTLHARSEEGFSLVELIVAAMLLVVAVIGIFTALEAAGRAGADQRHRMQAYEVAQQDQARLRAIKITQLLGLSQTRAVTVDETTYTVKSTSKIVSNATGDQSCDSSTASADYLSVASTVTWPGMDTSPVVIQSLIAPPNGTFDPTHGALAVAVRDGQGVGIPNIPLTGSGAGSFSGITGENGCAIFPNLPAGNYTVTPTASSYVDKDGKSPGAVPTSVVAQSTNTIALQLGRPGSIDVTFQTKVGTQMVPSKADGIVVFNTGMTTAKTFGTVNNRVATITATPLFPFSSPDTVYAGACTWNNPTTAPDAAASVTVSPGITATPLPITLPALNLTVWRGTSTSPGLAAGNARVTVTDSNGCTVSGSPVKRVLATNSSGKLDDPGLPFGTYTVCVSGLNSSGSTRRVTTSNVVVKSTSVPTPLTVYLGSSFTSGSCP